MIQDTDDRAQAQPLPNPLNPADDSGRCELCGGHGATAVAEDADTGDRYDVHVGCGANALTSTPAAPPLVRPRALIFGDFEAATETEAHIMSESARVLHRRIVEALGALPWWRIGVRRGLRKALSTTGGACFEWADDADRLAGHPS